MTDDFAVLAVDHVGIAVPDLDSAIEFHCSTFGLQVTHREVNEEQGVAEAMLSPVAAAGNSGAGGSFAAESAAGGAVIQLLAPLTPESTIAAFIGRSGPGLQQLAYRVGDVEAAAAALRSKGVRVLYAEAKVGTGGALINFVHPKDTGGVLIELVQLVDPPK